MRYPVYPEWYVRNANSEKNKQKVFMVLGIIGIATTLISFLFESEGLLIAGLICTFVFLSLFMAFRGWRFVLNWVEFDENGISVKDDRGDLLKQTEYRYIRHAEIRTLPMTVALKEASGQGYEADLQAYEHEKLILIYIDSVYCFEDLKLIRLGKKDNPFYWCDEILDHCGCIAMAYNEEAWNLLQSRLPASATCN